MTGFFSASFFSSSFFNTSESVTPVPPREVHYSMSLPEIKREEITDDDILLAWFMFMRS